MAGWRGQAATNRGTARHGTARHMPGATAHCFRGNAEVQGPRMLLRTDID
jgi:hypothetical protein